MPLKIRRQIVDIHEKVMIYLRLQRYQAAEELLQGAINEFGALANLLNLMGLCCHKQSRFSEAIENFEKARAANPRYIEAALNLSVTLSDLGFYENSQKVYDEMQYSRDHEQDLPDLVMGRLANLHCNTAQGYEHAGLLDQASQEYARALQIYGRMPDIRLRLAKIYLRMESYQQSREQLLFLLEDNPNSTELLNLLGAIAFRMGDWDQAQKFWQKTQSINPGDQTSKTYLSSQNKA
ncbi:MAG: tetratricopeptide repeat protein, partial [Proteobacteria bacterium]|nr:tetratricopeptide repeat protein [Pseudomonadota bacterium]